MIDITLKNKKGETKSLECSATRVRNGEKGDGLIVITRDVTDRERVKEELKLSEERYKNIVETAPDGILTVDLKGTITSCNDVFSELTGFTKEEILGKHFSYLPTMRKRDLPRYLKMFVSMVRGKVLKPFEIKWIHRDGTERSAEIRASVIKKGKKITGFQAIARDITERKQAEIKDKQHNEFLDSILESLTHPFYVIDAQDYTIRVANKAAYRGNLQEGTTCFALTHKRNEPCNSEEHPCPVEMVKKSKKPVIVEHIHYDINGTPNYMEVHAYPIFGDDGSVVQVIEYGLDITERKKVGEALRESEEKFRNLAEKSPNMIFINKRGRMVYANEKCEEIMGYSKEEFYSSGFDFTRLSPPESRHLVKKSYAAHMKGEEVEPYEYSLITKEGKKLNAILTTKLIDYNGEKAILEIITDITDIKKAETAIRENEKRLSTAQQIAHLGFWEWDIKTNELYWSDETYRLLNHKPQEFKPRYEDFLNILHPEDKNMVLKAVDSALKGKAEYNIDHRIVLHTGETRYINSQGELTRDDKGSPIHMMGTMIDITERKKTEEKMSIVKASVDAMADAVLVFNLDGDVVFSNKAHQKMFSLDAEDIIGKNIMELPGIDYQKEEEVERFMPLIEDTVKKGASGPTEIDIVTLKGKEISVSVNGGIVRDANNEPKYIVAAMRDITERRKAEDALRLQSEITINMSEGVYLIRAEDGIIVYANPKFEEMFGYDTGEIVGKHVSIVNASGEKEPNEIAKEIINELDKTGVWKGEINNIKKDGTPF